MSTNRHEQVIASISEYLLLNLNKPVSISQLAHSHYISESKLKQDFKKYKQLSLVNWLLEQRMQKAFTLLQQSDSKISDIAEEVGYSNVSSFNREFRKHYACSPQEIRNGNSE